MAADLLSLLVDELAKLFQPVTDVVENPILLARLLAEIGAESDTAGGDALATALSAIATLVDDARQLAAKPSPSFQDIAGVLAAVGKAFEALRALSHAGGPAEQLENFGTDLADFLVASYLMRSHPLARQIAALLTLVELEETQDLEPPVVVGGQMVRGAYRIDRFHLDRISDLLSDPVGTLRAAYVTPLVTVADTNAMADKLFPRLHGVLRELDVACRYGFREGDEPLLGDAAPIVDHALIVWAADTLMGATEEAGVVFTLSPAERGDLGLLASPFGALQVQTEAGPWAIELDVTAEVEGVAYGRHGVTLLASPGTAEVDAKLTATLAAPDQGPAFVLGSPNASRLEVGGSTISAQTTLSEARQSLAISAAVSKAAIFLSPGDGDGFLQQVLPAGGLHAEFDLGIAWSNEGGLSFHGAAGLEAILPVGLSIGGVVRVPSIYLGLRADDTGVQAEVSTAVALSIGPVQALVDRLGVLAVVSFPQDGGNLGPADLSFDFKPPSGVGLAIDAAGVGGGGVLEFDPAKHEYSGVLQLSFAELALQAFGLITTQVAGGAGYSLLALVDANFPPVELGLGFTLNGVGGLLAVHRTADVDALRAATKAGKLSTILFPKSAIANAPQVLAQLDALFPTAPGRFLFGPMALIGWGTPTVLTASVAVILELPDPIRIVLLGVVQALFPTPSAALIRLNMDALGVIDFSQDELSLDATLFDSRLITYTIAGDMALRAGWGSQSQFLLAIGGFHPQFTPPPGFPALKRVTIDMPAGIVAKLRLSAYLAVTSNSLQFGSALDVFIGVSGFGLSGHLGFDALLQLNPFHFEADISGSIALTAGGDDLMSVSLDATLTGPAPWNIAGKFKIHIVFFDVHVSFSQSWGLDAPAQQIANIDVGALLGAALADPRNWTAELPAGLPSLVSLREVKDPAAVFAHPRARLGVHERLVPLNLAITRFGEASPAGATRFSITKLQVGSAAVGYDSIQDQFAPAQFFALSDTDKLARPSFELHDAGVVMSGSLVATGVALPKTTDYETCFIDTPGALRVDEGVPQPFPRADIQVVMVSGAAARKTIGHAGDLRYTAPGNPIQVAEPAFALVDTASLSPEGAAPAGKTTYSDAHAMLADRLAAFPDQRDGLQIVATHEMAAA